MDTGERIKNLRRDKGLTLEELGYEVGVSRQTIQRYESGVIKIIPAKKLDVLADKLETTTDYLEGATDDPYDYHKDPDHRLDECVGAQWEYILKSHKYDLPEAYKAYMEFLKAQDEDSQLDTVTPVDLSDYVTIPVYGRIPAGDPRLAQEYIEGHVQVPRSWTLHGQEVAALKVVGESMIPLIQDGDTIIYRVQPDVESGCIAVCRIDGYDATVKKVLKQEPHTIILQPLNPKFQPIIFTGDASEEPLEIVGRVIEVRHAL